MADGSLGGALDQNVFKVRCGMQVNLQKIETGFKLRDVAVNDNSAEDVADAVDTWFNGAFKAILSTVDKLLYIDVTKMFSEEGFRKEYVNVTGTMAGGVDLFAPTPTAVQISLKTQRRKRYGQGRMFWPCRAENWANGDFLNSTGIAGMQGVVDDLLSKFTGVSADLHLCNAHLTIPPRAATTTSPARPEIAPHWYDVDTVKINEALTFIHSRKSGVGV